MPVWHASLVRKMTPSRILGRLGRAGRAFVHALSRPNAPLPFDPEQASLTADEIPLLRRLVEQSGDAGAPIVEIGTLIGLTTAKMATWKAPCQRIVTVDNYCWNPWGLSAAAHRSLAGHVLYYLIQAGHVEQVCMGKDEFYASYEGPPPALVFLDAMHTYEETAADIAWARHVGARTVSGHDYSHEFPGVVQAVDEAGGPKTVAGSLWVL